MDIPPTKRPAPNADPVVRDAAADAADDEAICCSVFDPHAGRPCGSPVEAGTLTCAKHRVRPTRTQVSRTDAARRRYGG